MLIACGLNHKTAPVAIREKVAFAPHDIARPLQSLIEKTNTEEAVILTTCNRTELYCNSDDPQQLFSWLSDWHQVSHSTLSAHFYQYQERAAQRHLLEVACGLDSMMLGESQIIGQLKTAYKMACECGTVSTYLDDVFQHVFKISKKIRSTTDVGKNAISVASAAVNLAKQVLGALNKSRVLLIGSGETIELVAHYFREQGVRSFSIANRTREKAEQLAEKIKGQALAIDELYEQLSFVDIVISATACPVTILDKSCVERAMAKRFNKSLVMVDLAVPRDIEASVSQIKNVYLYNIDDLQQKAILGLEHRKQAASHAEIIIEQALDQFAQKRRSLLTVDSIRHYRSQLEIARDQEIALALNKLKQGSDPTEILKKLAHRLTNKALHFPSKKLRQVGVEGNETLLALTRQLFADEIE